MLGYILVSYGPKPTGHLAKCKAARQQVRNLQHLAEHLPNKPELYLCHDYARTVTSLSSLPVLERQLEHAKKRNGVIFVDSYRRLFAKCKSIEDKNQLLTELLEFSANMRDLQTQKKLDELPSTVLARILTTPAPIKFVLGPPPKSKLSKKERKDQTRKATRASQIARAAAADRKAEKLNKLREELETEIGSVNFSQLARAANERGLKTTRNQVWSSSSVKRALNRLKNNPD